MTGQILSVAAISQKVSKCASFNLVPCLEHIPGGGMIYHRVYNPYMDTILKNVYTWRVKSKFKVKKPINFKILFKLVFYELPILFLRYVEKIVTTLSLGIW